MGESTGLFAIALGIAIIVTFFVIASRLGSIKDILKTLLDLELKKPENRITISCEKCKENFTVSKLRKGELVSCPNCKELNRA